MLNRTQTCAFKEFYLRANSIDWNNALFLWFFCYSELAVWIAKRFFLSLSKPKKTNGEENDPFDVPDGWVPVDSSKPSALTWDSIVRCRLRFNKRFSFFIFLSESGRSGQPSGGSGCKDAVLNGNRLLLQKSGLRNTSSSNNSWTWTNGSIRPTKLANLICWTGK